jgi:hypothetical protein
MLRLLDELGVPRNYPRSVGIVFPGFIDTHYHMGRTLDDWHISGPWFSIGAKRRMLSQRK